MYLSTERPFALLAALVVAPPTFAGIAFETSSIARLGEPAPVPAQLVQTSSPSLGGGGQIAFLGDGGIFLQTKDATTLVAAPGDPAPGGGNFVSMRMPLVNELGEVAFIADVAPPGRFGIFFWSDGRMSPIAQVDDPVPGGGIFDYFYELGMKGAGENLTISFSALFHDSMNQEALFAFSGGAFRRLVGAGDVAPGGGTFVNLYYPKVNLSGQVAFYAYLNPPASGLFIVQPDGSITAVARSGDPAPEGGTFEFPAPSLRLPAGRELFADGAPSYTLFSLPSLNENGDVAFAAITTLFGRGGIFLYSDGQIIRRVRENVPAPGGGIFYNLSDAVLNTAGQIAFYGNTSTVPGFFLFSPEKGVVEIARRGRSSPEGDIFASFSTQTDLNASGRVAFAGQLVNSLGGIYLASPGEIDRIAGHGDPVDRDPIFTTASPIAIDSAGKVLFAATAFPGGSGLFVGPPSAPIVRLGDPAPGGSVFGYLDANRSAMNDESVVFAGSATTDQFNTSVYSFSDGELSRIARPGDPVPGGGTFSLFASVALNNSGDVALLGYANPPSATGLYILSGGVFSRVLALGDPAPDGGTFSSIGPFSLNDLRQIAFLGFVIPPGRSGIFRWWEEVVKPIARTDDAAPGGGMYTFNSSSLSYAPSLNAQGDVAFAAAVSNYFSGVFKFSDDVITRVAGQGDPIPGGGTIYFAYSASLNDHGQVAFYAATSGEPGVFVSSDGRLSAVARRGEPAPGGGTFYYCDAPRLNGQTQVGFLAGLPDGYGVFEASPTK